MLDEYDQTQLTTRDRNLFISLLDETDRKPNENLAAAARHYKIRSDWPKPKLPPDE